MVDGDQHDAASRQILAVVGLQFLAGTCLKTATVQPDHYGPLAVVIDVLRPDIHTQTVFSLKSAVPRDQESHLIPGRARPTTLRADEPVLQRTSNAGPGSHFSRRHKPHVAARR